MGRRTLKLKPPEPSEDELQDLVVKALQWHGYRVLEMGRWRKQVRCPRCGEWFHRRGSYGNTTGCPDLAVSHRAWPAATWLLIEMKACATADVTKEQQELADEGRSHICWSEAMVWRQVRAFEASLGLTPGPPA